MEGNEIIDLIEKHVANYFSIKSFHADKESFYFITYNYNKDNFARLVADLDKIGYVPFINEHDMYYKIDIGKKHESGKSNIHVNIILFLATVVSTIFAGYFFGERSLIEGITFSIALLAIIGSHETAHFFAARKHGVEATLPYFIPAPTLIGTFGAVINIKSAIPDKNALFDLGVSGPIAGFFVTIPVLIIGFSLSTVVPMQNATVSFIPSPLMYIASYFAAPAVPEGYILTLSPILFAAWVGIIVTMLNLMPVAFLDGGHISRSLFSEKIHKYISIIGIIVTLALGWIPMALLMFVILFMSKKHHGALDNVSKLSRNRKIMAALMVVVLFLCLSPLPLMSFLK